MTLPIQYGIRTSPIWFKFSIPRSDDLSKVRSGDQLGHKSLDADGVRSAVKTGNQKPQRTQRTGFKALCADAMSSARIARTVLRSEVARHGRWRSALLFCRGAVMLRPAGRSNRQICDALRSYATPYGRLLPDFAGWSGYPLIAALSVDPEIDAMCRDPTSHQWRPPRLHATEIL